MDSLGVQGGTIPGLAPGGMVPVLQVGNLGDNFAAQVFEARGVGSYWGTTATTTAYLTWSLHSRAAGGTVIEDLKVDTTQLGSFSTGAGAHTTPNGYWLLGRGPNPLGATAALPTANVGGPDTRNEFAAGQDTGIPSLNDWPIQLPNNFDFTGLNFWIPPGEYLNVALGSWQQAGPDAPGASVTVQWREIPEVQGVAR